MKRIKTKYVVVCNAEILLHAGFNIFRKLMAQKLRVNTQFARIVEQCRLFTFLKLR